MTMYVVMSVGFGPGDGTEMIGIYTSRKQADEVCAKESENDWYAPGGFSCEVFESHPNGFGPVNRDDNSGWDMEEATQ